MRVTGTNSGLDVDKIVKDSLKGDQTKIDTAYQEQMVYEYQQEQYRKIMTDASDFYSKYFDTSRDSNLLLAANYQTLTYESSDNSVSAKGFAGAQLENYNVVVNQIAKKASVTFKQSDLNSKIDGYGKGLIAVSMTGTDGKEKNVYVDIVTSKVDGKYQIDMSKTASNIKAALNKEGVNVSAKYSEFSQGIILESGNFGEKVSFNVALRAGKTTEDVNEKTSSGAESFSAKSLKDELKTLATTYNGQNAKGRITKGVGDEVKFYDFDIASNSQTLDNIQFTFNSKTPGTGTVTSSTSQLITPLASANVAGIVEQTPTSKVVDNSVLSSVVEALNTTGITPAVTSITSGGVTTKTEVYTGTAAKDGSITQKIIKTIGSGTPSVSYVKTAADGKVTTSAINADGTITTTDASGNTYKSTISGSTRTTEQIDSSGSVIAGTTITENLDGDGKVTSAVKGNLTTTVNPDGTKTTVDNSNPSNVKTTTISADGKKLTLQDNSGTITTTIESGKTTTVGLTNTTVEYSDGSKKVVSTDGKNTTEIHADGSKTSYSSIPDLKAVDPLDVETLQEGIYVKALKDDGTEGSISKESFTSGGVTTINKMVTGVKAADGSVTVSTYKYNGTENPSNLQTITTTKTTTDGKVTTSVQDISTGKITTTLPDGTVKVVTVDGSGNVSTTTLADGSVITTSTDGSGNKVLTKSNGGVDGIKTTIGKDGSIVNQDLLLNKETSISVDGSKIVTKKNGATITETTVAKDGSKVIKDIENSDGLGRITSISKDGIKTTTANDGRTTITNSSGNTTTTITDQEVNTAGTNAPGVEGVYTESLIVPIVDPITNGDLSTETFTSGTTTTKKEVITAPTATDGSITQMVRTTVDNAGAVTTTVSYIKTAADGKITTTTEMGTDGSGNRVVKTVDSNGKTYNTTIDKTTGTKTTLIDGQTDAITEIINGSGLVEATKISGTAPNTVTTKTVQAKDGTITTTVDNTSDPTQNSSTVVSADGKMITTNGPDGKMTTQTIISQDGTQTITAADGRTTIISPDGTKMTTSPKGVTSSGEGDKIITSADGNTVTQIAADGTKTITEKLKDINGDPITSVTTTKKSEDGVITKTIAVTDKNLNTITTTTQIAKDGTETKTIIKPDGTFESTVTEPAPTVLKGKNDVTALKDKIVSFIDGYNKIIEEINTKLLETRNKNYMPLTDAQKESMTDSQIETWEKKAKTGLLRNDSDLQAIANEMKAAMTAMMSGTNLTLEKIGIHPVDNYTTKNGMYSVRESELVDALQSDSGAVKDLFTRIESTTDSSDKGGIFTRLKTTFENQFISSASNLSKKAGLENLSTSTSNTLSKKIKEKKDLIVDLKSKYIDKENALYKKYSALETAMEKLNSQQASLGKMLGQA